MTGPSTSHPPVRQKAKTPAERAEEGKAIQRQLKLEAAERRDAAKAATPPSR